MKKLTFAFLVAASMLFVTTGCVSSLHAKPIRESSSNPCDDDNPYR